jgi:hypothetical protein
MDFKALLGFNSMITPVLITGLYWLLLVALLLVAFFAPSYVVPGGFFGRLLIIVIGAVLIRVWCELLIVIFKINDNLKALAKQGQ